MKLVYDIESDGLLDSITKIWVLVTQDVDTGEQYAFSDYDDNLLPLADGLAQLQSADILIGHNVIGYDAPAIKKVTGVDLSEKKTHDTFIMSQVLRYKRKHKHGLAGWGEAMGDAKIDYHDWTNYNNDMLVYCKQDVALNAKVYQRLLQEYAGIYKMNPLIKEGLRVEHEVAKLNVIMREQGWNIDMDLFKSNMKRMKDRLAEIDAYMHPRLGKRTVYIDKEPKTPKYKKNGNYTAVTCRLLTEFFGFEVIETDTHLLGPGREFRRSKEEQVEMGQQALVKEYLLSIGWKPDEQTRKKVNGQWVNLGPKFTSTSLKKLGEVGEMVDEYYTLRNRLSVYEGWEKKLKDGRLHGNMWTVGTPSMRCRHEVIVNLPSVNASWGKELREIFVADEGEVVMGCDSSGNQLRGLCHYVNNDEYTDTVINGDQHQRNADALGCTRPQAKTFLYAYLFGAGDAKLGQAITNKLDAKKGKQAREDFAASITGLKEIKEKVEGEWLRREHTQGAGWISALDGRPIFVSSDHQCLNYLLQSAEGITCKASFVYAWEKIKELGLRAKPRLFYHDEHAWTVHPDDVEAVGKVLEESFKEAPRNYGVETMEGGDYCVGSSYADVH